ncbi:DUF5677 domain-containing protein [Macrococcoides canis]|uniref:DUF5677 domain-containing protein n=1 Tax=Macrococcoides canis TaxID=1855823 RepID=UPI0020B76F60|nr:DUF5677 domain-containing protein [Macrococcus canis]UTG99647.1 hypothetical protein KFV04_09130 [Macrococcus canis]
MMKKNITDLKKESEIDDKDIALIQLIDLFSSHYQSLEVLIKNNSYNSLSIIARLLFEIYIYIIYILEKDSINRSKRFLIQSKNAQMKVLEDVYLENELGSKIRKEFNLDYNHLKKLVEKINILRW